MGTRTHSPKIKGDVMRKIKTLLAVGLSLAAVGCVPPQPKSYTHQNTTTPAKDKIVQRADFPVKEYEALAKKGSGKVTGELFAVTRGGDVKIGAGEEVRIQPETSYTKNQNDLLDKIDLNTQTLSPADPRKEQYIRRTTTDSQGKYEFTDVPPGTYRFNGFFTWYAGSLVQVATFSQIITVENNKTTKVPPGSSK